MSCCGSTEWYGALCFAAIQQSGWALEFVPGSVITSELCLAAVQQNGLALEHVPEGLMSEELCLAAVQWE